MGILDRFKTKKGEEKVSMPAKAVQSEPTEATEKPVKEPKKAAKTSKKSSKSAKELPAALQGILTRPLVTEKAAHLASTGTYTFFVNPSATRVQVRAAVKAAYGILPERVNIQNVRGKAVRFGRFHGRRSNWKKAIVTLPKGKTIDVYEGV